MTSVQSTSALALRLAQISDIKDGDRVALTRALGTLASDGSASPELRSAASAFLQELNPKPPVPQSADTPEGLKALFAADEKKRHAVHAAAFPGGWAKSAGPSIQAITTRADVTFAAQVQCIDMWSKKVEAEQTVFVRRDGTVIGVETIANAKSAEELAKILMADGLKRSGVLSAAFSGPHIRGAELGAIEALGDGRFAVTVERHDDSFTSRSGRELAAVQVVLVRDDGTTIGKDDRDTPENRLRALWKGDANLRLEVLNVAFSEGGATHAEILAITAKDNGRFDVQLRTSGGFGAGGTTATIELDAQGKPVPESAAIQAVREKLADESARDKLKWDVFRAWPNSSVFAVGKINERSDGNFDVALEQRSMWDRSKLQLVQHAVIAADLSVVSVGASESFRG